MSDVVITIPYADWLGGGVWPSDSNRDAIGQPKPEPVMTMAPQHAAACLAKLINWAQCRPSGFLFEIQDIDERESIVRTSELGLSLAARALSLYDANDIYAVYSDVTDLPRQPGVLLLELISRVYSSLVISHPLANKADLATVATSVAAGLFEDYDIRLQPPEDQTS